MRVPLALFARGWGFCSREAPSQETLSNLRQSGSKPPFQCYSSNPRGYRNLIARLRDGGEPYKGVTLDPKGNLYGTAVTGGGGSCEGGCGTVFQLAKAGGGVWNFSVVHTFTGGSDGSGPGAPLAIDKSGNIFGMAPTG